MKAKELSSLFGMAMVSHENNMILPEIYACGQDRIYRLDTGSSTNGKANILWTWLKSETIGDIPDDIIKSNAPVNDCKPKNNNNWVLVTDGYAVILLENATKKALFYAHTPNSHSSELLPNNRIAVALSITEKGNAIEIYDIDKSDQVLFRDTLYGCHGVVWINERERLYVLGTNELREYSLEKWMSSSPRLKLEASWELPTNHGHDLYSVSNNKLLVTTAASVYEFELHQKTFSSFKPLETVNDVKSVYYNEKTNQLIYTMAEPDQYTKEESWWTENIYIRNPDRKITIPKFRMYKVRAIV